MSGLWALLALVLLGGSSSSLPMTAVGAFSIPAQYDGFTVPPKLPATKLPIVLEAFIDPMCPDCRSAWPTITALLELYGSKLSLIIHLFPVPLTQKLEADVTIGLNLNTRSDSSSVNSELAEFAFDVFNATVLAVVVFARDWIKPALLISSLLPVILLLLQCFVDGDFMNSFPVHYRFHHNAFFSARLLQIANSLNSSATVPLLELIYKHQDSLSNDATADETPSSVVKRFVSLAPEVGLSFDEVYKGFSDTSSDQATRISFKYGCSRYVTSTPSYLVNGVGTEADETWSVGRWRSILEPLFGRTSALKVASAEDGGNLRNYLQQ